eukprot:SAG31_NODE_15945_length_730_cov_1.136292_1_plen_129_part_01
MARLSRRLSRTLAALSCGSACPPDGRVPADEAVARFSAAVHDGAGWGRWPTLEGDWGQEGQEAQWEPAPDGRGGTLSVNRDPPGEPGIGEYSYGGATAPPEFHRRPQRNERAAAALRPEAERARPTAAG